MVAENAETIMYSIHNECDASINELNTNLVH